MQLPSPLVLLLFLGYFLFILVMLLTWVLLTYRQPPPKRRRQAKTGRKKAEERPRYIPVVKSPREASPKKTSYAAGEDEVLGDFPPPERKRE